MDLPLGNEPLQLADGTKIDCDSGKVIKDTPANFVVVPSPSEAQALIVKARKTVAELPLPPEKLSGVALVAFYSLYGLGDRDIALAINCALTEHQIKEIRKLDAYQDFMAAAKQNILHTEQQTVRDLFEKHAAAAAAKVISLAGNENDVLAFKASQDVLDRAGHRPADVVEHRHKMEDALNIVITRRDENQEVPTIDVTPEHIDADVS